MLIALVSGKGAPGVTTTALALTMAWPRPALLVELDPTGGDVRLGYGQGIRTDGRGLTMLRDERRSNLAARLWDNVLQLEGHEHRWWLPGVDHPRQARLMDWTKIADLLTESGGLGVDVIADCGTYWTERPPRQVWQAAILVGLIVRPTVPGVATARITAEALVADLETGGLGADRLVGIPVGGGSGVAPYPVRDVREALPSLPIPTSIAWDRRGADILTGISPARRRPSKLMKQAAAAAEALLDSVDPTGRESTSTSTAAFYTPPSVDPAPLSSADPDATQIIVNTTATPGPLVGVAALAGGRHASTNGQAAPIAPDTHTPEPPTTPRRQDAAPAARPTGTPLVGFAGAVPPPPPPAEHEGGQSA